MHLYEKIPNNVNLSHNRRLLKALESWLPDYLKWWQDAGPEGFQADDIYLRTAISVDSKGWAHFDYVKMPDYRWGIFLAPPEHDRRIGFGDFYGNPAWQEVPGEFRNHLRRIIVTQGDTEPASVEQQRLLGNCALHVRRAQPLPGERRGGAGTRGPWLPAAQPLRPGRREEAEELLERRSGDLTSRASSPPSTSPSRTGCRSSCSRCSPTGTASTSCWPGPSRSTPLAHHPLHAHRGGAPRSWARPGWDAWCSGLAS